MKMKKRIIFINSGGEFLNTIFKDVEKREDVVVYNRLLKLPPKLLSRIKVLSTKLSGSKLFDNIILFPLNKFFSVLRKVSNTDERTILIFISPAMQGLSKKYFAAFLKEHKNIVPVIFFVDVIEKNVASCARQFFNDIPQFTCATFDEGDAKRYNILCIKEIFSKLDLNYVKNISSDIYYIGDGSDGKLEMLHKLMPYFENNYVRANINIAHIKKKKRKYSEIIHYIRYKSYLESVNDMNSSNCIIELQKEGQTAATIRYYEAVCYNKKLLTSNKNVVNLAFYDSRYMKVFEKPEDIDWEWVKERIPVDYHYDGCFSPVHLIDKIIELEEEKERKELGTEQTD